MLRRAVWLFAGGVAVVAAGAAFAVGWQANGTKAIVQPVAFNHKVHVETGLECGDCHGYFETQTFSGLPTISQCMDCHEEAITTSPEEEKVRELAAAGLPLEWEQIYRVPDHVYYSHRRHVIAGKLDCATCHGDIAETTSPPDRPLNDLSMDFCLNCHQQNNVTEDCIACHK